MGNPWNTCELDQQRWGRLHITKVSAAKYPLVIKHGLVQNPPIIEFPPEKINTHTHLWFGLPLTSICSLCLIAGGVFFPTWRPPTSTMRWSCSLISLELRQGTWDLYVSHESHPWYIYDVLNVLGIIVFSIIYKLMSSIMSVKHHHKANNYTEVSPKSSISMSFFH